MYLCFPSERCNPILVLPKSSMHIVTALLLRLRRLPCKNIDNIGNQSYLESDSVEATEETFKYILVKVIHLSSSLYHSNLAIVSYNYFKYCMAIYRNVMKVNTIVTTNSNPIPKRSWSPAEFSRLFGNPRLLIT